MQLIVQNGDNTAHLQAFLLFLIATCCCIYIINDRKSYIKTEKEHFREKFRPHILPYVNVV